MAKVSKTPVMVLQELIVKSNLPPPEYNLTYSKNGTHDNEFHYQVTAAGVCAEGIGRSKQVAKHDAARKALELLEENGVYRPDQNPVTNLMCMEEDVPRLAVNHIGVLSDMCIDNKLQIPSFEEISVVGPPHCREFTYQCQIASITTRATAGTKRQAKQAAAKEMMERIGESIPDLINDNKLCQLALTNSESQALSLFVPKFNLGVKVREYDQTIKDIMADKNMSYADIAEYLNGEKTEENLKLLLEKLELTYIIEEVEPQIILALSLSTETPFTVMAMGRDYEDTKVKVLIEAFENLQTHITSCL